MPSCFGGAGIFSNSELVTIVRIATRAATLYMPRCDYLQEYLPKK